MKPKDRKHTVANMFFKLSRFGLVSMITSINLSQETLAIDVLTVLKSSLKHHRKHILQLLQLYGDQALMFANRFLKLSTYALVFT